MKFTDGLFLQSCREIAPHYPQIEFEDRLVDNMALQLVQRPEEYDVIVSPNLYGDILSDLAAGLVGGLGVAPGANFGDAIAVFEPVHGTAPTLAGLHKADPTALILSGMMMVTRVMFGDALVIGLMAFAPNAPVLLVLRLLMGMLGGFAPATNALVTSIAPRERISFVLGFNQTAQFIGIMVGPLVGGLIADRFGFRPAFLFTAVLCLLVGVAIVLLVEEPFTPPARKAKAGFRARVRELGGNRALMLVAVALFGIQFGNLLIQPMMPLYVQSLGVPADQVATAAGLTLSVAALPSALAAANTGRLASRLGLKWLLFASLLGAGLLSLPQAFIGSFPQLLLLRGLMGFFSGLALPTASSIVAAVTPPERRATAFGVSGSATLLGQASGPLTGGVLVAGTGLHGIFLVSGAAFLAAAALVGLAVRAPHPSE